MNAFATAASVLLLASTMSGADSGTVDVIRTNVPPTIEVVVNEAVVYLPDPVVMCLRWQPPAHAVTMAEFYADGRRIDQLWIPRAFCTTWTNATPGMHVLTAISMDWNGAWSTSNPVRVDIRMKIIQPTNGIPEIRANVTNRVITLGESVTVVADAVATLPMTFQWFHERSELANETNATLTISNFGLDDRGRYSVLVKTLVGAASADIVYLTAVSTTPGVIDFRNLSTAPARSSWQMDYGDGYDAQLFAGPQPDILVPIGAAAPFRSIRPGFFRGGVREIPWASPGESVYVQVRISPGISGGQFSNLFSLVLGDNLTAEGPARMEGLQFPSYPEWLWPPGDPSVSFTYRGVWYDRIPPIIVTAGSDVTINGKFGAYGDTAAWWRKNGIPIPNTEQFRFRETDQIGSGGLTGLVITNVQYSDAGVYAVVAEIPGLHRVISSPVVVSVTEPLGGRFLSSGQVQDGVFSATLRGSLDKRYELQVTTNLTDWITLTTVTNVSGEFGLRDPDARAGPQRFYRVATEH